MLHSAASNETGIPQAILDLKQEELRQRQQIKDAFEVALIPPVLESWCPASAWVV